MKTSSIPVKSPAPSAEQTTDRLPSAIAAGLVFVASGGVLVLEILAVRLLAPYVGLTLQTTTSIIGAVLAGIAGGAALGGWIADRTDPRRLAVGLLIGGGLLALLTLPIVRALGPPIRGEGNAAAIGVTFAALVPVAAVLSAVSPTVARLQLNDLHASGTVVGRLSAWATAGALVGTFGTGFVLVPRLAVSSTVVAVGVVLVLAGIALGAYTNVLDPAKTVGAVVLTAALSVLTPALHNPCDAESTYHCVRIEVDPERPTGRLLILDQEFNSYVDVKDPRYLAFDYTRWIGDAIATMGNPKAPLNAVFVGGGGFTLPRWLLAMRPGSHADVFEVDGKLVEFDRRHLGLRTSPNLRAIVGDARLKIQHEPTASADVVVGDAFTGLTVPWQLMTTQWLQEVRRVLRPNGVYALNMIDLRPLRLLRAEAATLLATFNHVRLITPIEGGRPRGDNEVLLASDGPLPREHEQQSFGASVIDHNGVVRLVAGAKPLRDDYAPVDQLQSR